jgi:hypothetical protein
LLAATRLELGATKGVEVEAEVDEGVEAELVVAVFSDIYISF